MKARASLHRGDVVIYYCNKSVCRFPLQIKLSEKKKNGKYIEWDYRNNNLLSIYPDHQKLNELISVWTDRANGLINEFKFNNIYLTGKELKRHLDSSLVSLSQKAKLTVLEYYEEFYNVKKEYLTTSEGKSASSLKDYTSFRNLVKDYVNENGEFTFLDINENWLKSLKSWMQKKRSKGCYTRGCLGAKTIKKRFDTIKTFFIWCSTKSYIPIQSVEMIKRFNREELSKPKTFFDTLSKKQVLDFYNYNFKSERLNNVRDVFVFSCMTSLRYQDLMDVHSNNVKRGRLIKVAHKTRNTSAAEHHVPLNTIANEIWERHSGRLPYFSNAKLNEYVKEAFKKSELFHYEGNRIDSDGHPTLVEETIVLHDARRTFISNFVIHCNVPWHKIMKMTGHTKVESLYKYIDNSRELDEDVTEVLASIKESNNSEK